MKQRPTLFLLTMGAAGAMGYVFYYQHQVQTQLNAQLYQLDQLLTVGNEDAHRRTKGTVRGIQAAVIKNQNQPNEVAISVAAQDLHDDADSLVLTLRWLAGELRLSAGDTEPNTTLASLSKIGEAEKLLGPTSAAQQGLQQQLIEYRAALQALNPAGKAELFEPQFAGLPVVAALANLSQLESEVRAAELNALEYLIPQVGAKQLNSHLAGVYSAESNVVAPGETYRAELFLASVFDLRYVPGQMRCDGHPVSVDSSSVGQVRFVAPRHPGPAAWTGTIRFKVNGRDTTFQVRVPYRVARR